MARISAPGVGVGSSNSGNAREVYEEIRVLTQQIDDEALRERFAAACERLEGEAGRREHAGALSPRELDVVSLIAHGYSNQETGSRLGLTTETVKSYLRNASRKLGTHNRTETVACARRAGLVP